MEHINSLFRYAWMVGLLATVWFFAGPEQHWTMSVVHGYYWVTIVGLIILISIIIGFMKYFQRRNELLKCKKDTITIINATGTTWFSKLKLLVVALIHGYVFWTAGWIYLTGFFALLTCINLFMNFYLGPVKQYFIWEKLKA